MTKQEIIALTDVSLITCIVQRGQADKIIRAAREAGAQGATVNFAKGMGIRERLGIFGVAVDVEKEVIQVVVSSEQQERIFKQMYLAGEMNTPGMGIMYLTRLDKAATYVPPDVLKKLGAKPKTGK